MYCGGSHLRFPILGQLKLNCPGMIIGRFSTKFLFFYVDRKLKMAATAGHRLTLDPMGDLSMIIPGQLGFNYPIGFREEAF
jgi:hypothetical protein